MMMHETCISSIHCILESFQIVLAFCDLHEESCRIAGLSECCAPTPRFDYSGNGESQGDFKFANYPAEVSRSPQARAVRCRNANSMLSKAHPQTASTERHSDK